MSNQPIPLTYALPGQTPRRSRGLFGWFVLGALTLAVFLVLTIRPAPTEISLSHFYQLLAAGKIQSITVQGNQIRGMLDSPLPGARSPDVAFRTQLPPGMSASWSFIEWLLENRHGAEVSVDGTENLAATILVPLIPWVLIFGFIWFFVFRTLRRQGIQVHRPVGSAQDPLRVVVVDAPVAPLAPSEPS